MTMLDEIRAEFAAALAVMRPQLEGFEDMNRLDLIQATDHVRASITDDERRKLLIVAADEALAALQADGWPELKRRVIPAAALVELLHQRATYDAALERFTGPEQAEQIVISASDPEPQP